MYSIGVSYVQSAMRRELTLPPGSECACRHLVSELSSLFAAELLPFFTREESLILIHLLLVLSHPLSMRHGGVRGLRIIPLRRDTTLSHRVQELGDLLLDERVGWWVCGTGSRRLALSCSSCTLSLLLDDLLLLLLLRLCLGNGRLLLMDPGPETTDGTRLSTGGLEGCRDGTGVDVLGR
jgi:hypothetical protein